MVGLWFHALVGEDIVKTCERAAAITQVAGMVCGVVFGGIEVKPRVTAAQMVNDYWIAVQISAGRTEEAK